MTALLRFSVLFCLWAGVAAAQVAPQNPNLFWATPGTGTGYLGLRAIAPQDFNSGTGASGSTCLSGLMTWIACNGSSIINTGAAGQLAYYAAAGTTLSPLSTTTGTATIPTLNATYIQNSSGNIEILPHASTGSSIYIAPITPYNGSITTYVANTASGSSVSSGISFQTGTTNSAANFVLYDNSGSPFEQIFSGSGVTGGLNIYSQAGNLALASQAGSLTLSAATAVTSQTPPVSDNSTKIATTAWVNEQPAVGSFPFGLLASPLGGVY